MVTTRVCGSWNCARARCRTSRTACSPAACDGPGAARGAQQAADGVVHRGVAPVAHHLVATGYAQASVGLGSLQVARRGQGVGCVVVRLLGRDERAHGLVHDRALGALGRREQAGHHTAAGPSDAGRFAQRPPRVAGELERVDADHRVERGVVERQRLHVAVAQVGAGEPVAGYAQQAWADVQAVWRRAALGGQDEREAGAAAHVEHASARADAGGVEHRLEQRLVVRLGQVRPGTRVGAPQAALNLGRGADRPGAHGALTAGLMFWLSRKTLSGS